MIPTDPDRSPQAVLPLDYNRPADPWRPAVRLVAMAVVAQGVTMAAPAAWVGWLVAQRWAWPLAQMPPGELPVLAVQSALAVVGACLAAAGVAVLRRRPVGRSWLLWLEPITLALLACEIAAYLWEKYQRVGGRAGTQWGQMAARQVLYTASEFVLPSLAWAFFRRPETRPVSGSHH